MKAVIKGLEKVNYTSKKTGNPVDGITFHLERKDPNVAGSCVEQIFVNSESLKNLGSYIPPDKFHDVIGYGLEYEYNRFGMIQYVAVMAPSQPAPASSPSEPPANDGKTSGQTPPDNKRT